MDIRKRQKGYPPCSTSVVTESVFSGVCESVQMLQASKVQVCMITGDGRETAQEIARSLGILSRGGAEEGRGEGGQESFAAPTTKVMLSGSELDAMSDTQLTEVAESVGVYYRVSPLHKLRIVKALQRTGHVVGMTGTPLVYSNITTSRMQKSLQKQVLVSLGVFEKKSRCILAFELQSLR